jgi:endonuclease/exonuclease/phosphatase (EEP) superfamily protein YafD
MGGDRRLNVPAAWVLGIPTALLTLLTAAPLLRNRHWLVRMGEFPRVQIAWLAASLLLLAVWMPAGPLRLLMVAVNATVLGWQIYRILPYTPLWRREVRDASPDAPAESRLRVLVSNVLTPNRQADRLLAHIREYRPDVLLVLESDDWWERQLDSLGEDYPQVVRCPLDNLYGMHLYSRLPLVEPRIQFLVEPDVPSIHTGIELPDGRRVWMHGLHPAPPSPTENETSTERDAELTLVARSVADRPEPIIVCGDLNDVAWSRLTRLFRRVSGLLDPRIGRGMYCSFHAHWRLFRWPLDHVFHSRHFSLVRLHCLPDIGSDHFPLLFELALDASARGNRPPPEPEPDDAREARENVDAVPTRAQDVHGPGDGDGRRRTQGSR